MPAPLSIDLRERIVQAYKMGMGTYAVVAKTFSVGVASVSRLLSQKRNNGSLEPKAHGGGREHKLSEGGLAVLKDMIVKQPDITIAELSEALSSSLSTSISTSVVSRGIQRLGYTRKKNVSFQ